MNKEQLAWRAWAIFILLVAIILVIVNDPFDDYNKDYEAEKKKYYKQQMINFCELYLSKVENEQYVSYYYPCDKWIID